MNFYRMAYSGVATVLFMTLFPPFYAYSRMTGRYRSGLGERLGRYTEVLRYRDRGSPRIWIHAASVGEVSVALSIFNALEEMVSGGFWILSTTTEYGRRYAENRIANSPSRFKMTCVFAPIDLVWTARRALAAAKPDVMAWVETELWPNWLREAGRMGIRTALINGRISDRSIGRYMRIRPLMERTLAHVDVFSMIRAVDAHRIARMGAPRARIQVHGNAKCDIPVESAGPEEKDRMRKLFGIPEGIPVFIAGSIRGEEDVMVLDAFEKIVARIPETVMILAPRHMERVRQITQRAKTMGFSLRLRSELEAGGLQPLPQMVILDTIGELQSVYGIADVVFCGGSLVPTGGQNVLEAAVWGKPVLYGPSMEDFQEAKEILDQAGGGIQIRDGSELADQVLDLLLHPERAQAVGRRGREALAQNRGAARRHAEVLRRLL